MFNISVLLDVQANLPETSPYLSAQMALVSTFFQMFIVLGMYNFAPILISLHVTVHEVHSTLAYLRFILFIPRSVRLFNRTPMEYKYGSGSSIGGIQEEAALYGTGSRNL